MTSVFTTLLRLAKSLGTGANLSISNLSTAVCKLARFAFDAKLLTSTCVTFLTTKISSLQLGSYPLAKIFLYFEILT